MATDDFPYLRRDYGDDPLRREDLPAAPIELLREWLEAASAAGTKDANGMALATCDAQGRPHCRVVLCKQLDSNGPVFFTNRDSQKGRDLRDNPRAAATFWWTMPRERQVRLEGVVEMTDDALSDRYFASRPRQAQLAAASSPQSRVVEDRRELEALLQRLDVESGDGPILRPSSWGGYRLRPDLVEFWQGRSARMHDRFRFRRVDRSWVVERLAP